MAEGRVWRTGLILGISFLLFNLFYAVLVLAPAVTSPKQIHPFFGQTREKIKAHHVELFVVGFWYISMAVVFAHVNLGKFLRRLAQLLFILQAIAFLQLTWLNLHPNLTLFNWFNNDLENNIQGVILLGPGTLFPIVAVSIMLLGLLMGSPSSNEKVKSH